MDDVVRILALLGGIVAMGVAGAWGIAGAVLRVQRGRGPDTRARAATEERLSRVEQAVDAIAVEVERVGEGQRFLMQLMTDGRRLPGVADAEPAPRLAP